MRTVDDAADSGGAGTPRTPDQSDPDADRVRRAQAGDHDARAGLLAEYYPRLWGVCRRTLGSADAADDLAQEVMVRVLRGLDGFGGQSRFSTWAVRIAINACLSHLRKQKVRKTVPLGAMQGTDAAGSADAGTVRVRSAEPGAAGRVEQDETLRRLEHALSGLDPLFRVILVLRDMQQMEYAEIAAALDIPVGTVKSRLFRARTALRERLNDDEGRTTGEQEHA